MQSAFNELSIVIAISVGISFIMRLIRQPLIIGYILTGLIVGPAILNIVKSPETIEVFADFGIALLLVIVGLGLNPRVIKEVGKIAVAIAFGKIILATTFGFGLARVFGYDSTAAIYIGIATSFSSTIIILKLLSDKKEQNRLYGKISIGFLLIEDLVATTILIGVSAGGGGDLSFNDFWQLAYKIVFLIAALTTVRILFLARVNKLIAQSQEFLFLFAIGWGLGIASLFKHTGFSLEIGALIAGITLSPLPYSQEAAAKLKPLRDFFIVLFFIMMGSHLEVERITGVLPEALVFSLFVLVGNPLAVLSIMGISGYTKKTSFKTALTSDQVSEFSLILILLVNRLGIVNDDVVALITLVALITIGISTYLITYADSLYLTFERYLKLFERRRVKPENEKRYRHDLVLIGYQKGGAEFLKVFKQMHRSYIVVDYDPTAIDALENRGANYIYGDATDLELLDELGLEHSKMIVSNVSDLQTNRNILQWLNKVNQGAVFVCLADTIEEAAELYSEGASYVMLPHYIGSEKISAFIKRSGLKKSEFKKFRDKHLAYLQSHYELFNPATD